MKLSCRLLFAVALALSAPLAAAAHTPAPAAAVASQDRDQLAAKLLHEVYAARGTNVVQANGGTLGDPANLASDDKAIADLKPLAEAAEMEVATAQADRLEVIYGRGLFKDFTDGELRAGLVLLNDPSGRAYVAAGPNGAAAKALLAGASALMQQTPDGPGFLGKFKRWNGKPSTALDHQVFVLLFPDVLLRFADKIDGGGEAKPPTEAQTLGRKLARVLFDMAGDAEKDFAKEVSKTDFRDADFPPSWAPLAKQAMTETISAKPSPLEAVFGDVIASKFTIEELKAGVAFFESIPPEAIHQIMSGGSKAKTVPEVEAAGAKLQESPVGASFLRKFGQLSAGGPDEFTQGLVRRIMPDFIRRFAHKIQAAPEASQ